MNCGCGTKLGERNTSGRCRKCAVAHLYTNPDFVAKRAAGLKRKWADPLFRAEKIKSLKERHARARREKPGFDQYLRDRGKVLAANNLRTPEARANFLASRAEAGKKRSATVMAWCPPEYRDEYRRLVSTKAATASEAREIILRQVKHDFGKLSPFERQARAVQNGATLVGRVDRTPTYERTLGGVTGPLG